MYTDLFIGSILISTFVWVSLIYLYLRRKTHSMFINGIYMAIILPYFGYCMYIYGYLRMIKQYVSGYTTLMLSMDYTNGMLFIASISMLILLYVGLPFIIMPTILIVKHADNLNKVGILRWVLLVIGYILAGFVFWIVPKEVNSLSIRMFNCNLITNEIEPCYQFTQITNKLAITVSSNFSINKFSAQALVVIGAVSSVLGLVKTVVEIIKLIWPSKNDTKKSVAKVQANPIGTEQLQGEAGK